MDAVQSIKRKQKDLSKLMLSKYDVCLDGDKGNNFHVIFAGPKDTCYEGGVWNIHVYLPDQYPFKSPSIGFENKIFHPNVDENSGTVCLDVLNQTWTPIYELTHVFDVFLPQLLRYPNPTDPLNGAAASILLSDPEKFKVIVKVQEYVNKYAKNPEMLMRAKKQLEIESKEEYKKMEREDVSEKDSDLSETSLKSEEDGE